MSASNHSRAGGTLDPFMENQRQYRAQFKAQNLLRATQQKMKERHDRHVHPPIFKVGDVVFTKCHQQL